MRQPRQKPLRRTAGPKRTGRLKPVSTKQRAGQKEQAVAYAGAEDAGQDWCSVCGRGGAVEHSHLYGQGTHPEHRNNPLNWLQSCRACHREYENNKPLFAKKWPKAWAEIIGRMRQIDLKAYDFYAAKCPELYPD